MIKMDMIMERFEEDGTSYFVSIVRLDKELKEKFGGEYLTTVGLGNTGFTYPLNIGYKHPSYITEKFSMGGADAKNIAEKLNEYFATKHGKRVLKMLKTEVREF